jgi:hypothetical protein
MTCDRINLAGTTDYNVKYPPANAKKGYVARIRGTAPGAVKYDREFLGDKVGLVEGDEGLYERQRGDKKGGHTRWYHVLLSHPEHGLILSVDCEEELPKIAKLLDAGIPIQDAVEVTELRPSERYEGRMIFTARARSKAEAAKAANSAIETAPVTTPDAPTLDAAIDACWAILAQLPEKDAKAALAALKKRATPPQEKTAPSTATVLRSVLLF